MNKFMKLFNKRAEEIEKLAKDIELPRDLFRKAEEEVFKEFARKYLISKVVPVAMPADEDDEKAITFEEPNLLGIKFVFAIVRKLDDDGKFEVGYLESNTLDELGIELAELIRHAEQNINPMIKIENFQNIPEMAFFIWLCKKLKEMGKIPDDKDPEMPICAIRTSFGMSG